MNRRRVEYYTVGRAEITISFPEDRTVCQWCPFCRGEDSLKRHKCLITDEWLLYPFMGRGELCPVILEDE